MHPWLALWIFSMTMARALQGSFAVEPDATLDAGKARTVIATPIIVSASRYLQSDVVQEPLPDMLLDRLADLHWLENEPAMAI